WISSCRWCAERHAALRSAAGQGAAASCARNPPPRKGKPMPFADNQPLAGCRVVERSRSVAAAYAGKLLAAMGARVLMLEPEEGSALRRAPPWLEGTQDSALFAYLSLGKRSSICALGSAEGQAE